jgi:hypothetical protein
MSALYCARVALLTMAVGGQQATDQALRDQIRELLEKLNTANVRVFGFWLDRGVSLSLLL